MFKKITLLLIVFALFVSVADAKKKRRRVSKKKSKNQIALVVVDGAIVWSQPHFDSIRLAYLPRGEKVKVSSKTFGPYKMYRVRYTKNKVGYVADHEIRVIGKGGEQKGAPPQEPKGEDKFSVDGPKHDDQKYIKKDLALSNSMGVHYSMLGYSEEVLGQKPTSNLGFFGLKLTGVDFFLPTLMDINLGISLKPPSYYSPLSDVTPTGFIMNFDTLMVFPMTSSTDSMLYIGFGPLISYSSFKVVLAGRLLKISEMRLGAVAMGGAAYRMGQFVLRVEAKYFYEKTGYVGGLFGIQYSH